MNDPMKVTIGENKQLLIVEKGLLRFLGATEDEGHHG